jgi:phage shock protein PspC (stress-responsive transcriptional regulator)
MIQKVQEIVEKNAFGVCEWWGEKLGIKIQRIRLFFIYFSFISVGLSFFIYLAMAFVLEHKELFKHVFSKKRTSIWDL